MKKNLVLLAVLVMVGCSGFDYSIGDEQLYPTATDYNKMIDALENENINDKSIVEDLIRDMNIRLSNNYGYYTGNYSCHSFAWTSTNYYVSINIWIDENGNLLKDMCTYYK